MRNTQNRKGLCSRSRFPDLGKEFLTLGSFNIIDPVVLGISVIRKYAI